MNRKKIEEFTVSLSVFLLFFITVGVILFAADGIFQWDIFPPGIEKVIGFVLLSCLATIFSCVAVNVMINLSIIAMSFSEIANKLHNGRGTKKS